MGHAIDLSRRLFDEIVRPAMAKEYPSLLERSAIGVFGNGSDTLGLDDTLSRDHCWGPRINIVLTREDHEEWAEEFLLHLREQLPESFEGYPISYPRVSRAGISVETIDHFFRCFAKMENPPDTEIDWFRTSEADLFHLVGGEIFHDPLGEFTRRREAFDYYPDNIWKKKIADWCVYFTGSTSPYNVHRCSRRGDFISAEIFFGGALKRGMEICFLLNRTYAPYAKWQPRLLPTLPRLGTEVHTLIQEAIETRDWPRRVEALVEMTHLYAREIHGLGLTEAPRVEGFDPNFASLVLYESANQVYGTLPEEMLHMKFNEAEWWEVLVREVIRGSDEFFEESLMSRK